MDRVEENAYEILGLPPGPETAEADIKKAYRKLALIKHPDKNIGNPRAAEEFFQIQQAYDLLLDANGRAALDAYLRARAVRLEMKTTHDEKRRRVYEDLVRREQAAEGIREEESAKAKLRAEIERMRRAAEASRASSRPKSKTEASQSNVAVWLDGNSHELLDDLPARTVKVSWNRGTTSVDYDADQLRAIFSRYGTIADIIMKEGKKRKGSALITMVRQEDAMEALEKLSSDPMSPLLVLPLRFAEDKKLKGGNSGKDKLQASKLASLSSTISKPGAKSSLGARPSKPLFPAAATGRND